MIDGVHHRIILDNVASLSSLGARIGEEIAVSDWFEVSQERINTFAEATGDDQWIHVDPLRAAASPLGTTIAHGFLTLSLIAPTGFELLVARVQLKSVVNYGLEKVRFVTPVRSGKRVRNHIKLAAVDHKGGSRYLITTDNSIEIEGETRPALTASALAIFMA
jgi:acyl dehydratase